MSVFVYRLWILCVLMWTKCLNVTRNCLNWMTEQMHCRLEPPSLRPVLLSWRGSTGGRTARCPNTVFPPKTHFVQLYMSLSFNLKIQIDMNKNSNRECSLVVVQQRYRVELHWLKSEVKRLYNFVQFHAFSQPHLSVCPHLFWQSFVIVLYSRMVHCRARLWTTAALQHQLVEMDNTN